MVSVPTENVNARKIMKEMDMIIVNVSNLRPNKYQYKKSLKIPKGQSESVN